MIKINGGNSYMNIRTKNCSKKILGGALAVAIAGSFATANLTSLSASAYTDANGLYYADFNSFDDLLAYEKDYSIQLEAESIVLMKNQNNVLPLNGVKNISLFGNNSYAPLMKKNGNNDTTGFTMLTDALEMAGYNLNPRVESIYEVYGPLYTSNYEGNATGLINNSTTHLSNAIRTEIPTELFSTVEGSYQFYGDAAIYSIGREGNEDVDMPITGEDYADGEHALQLDDSERAMITYLEQHFSTVIVLINVAASMDLAELEDDPLIDAIVWIGIPGQYGMEAVGQVLNGTVNPSGRTTSTYAADLTKSPAYQNYVTNAEIVATAVDGSGEATANALSVQYEEDIYVGYKWYETAAAEGILKQLDNYDAEQDTYAGDDEYYNRSTGVVYPFGYGLSYTTFEQEFVDTSFSIPSTATLDTFIDVQVKVTNTGSVAGKEVVQLYINSPYYEGEVEKSEVSLVSFAKTDTLKPGQSQVVTLSVRVGDIASFDTYGISTHSGTQGYCGYIIDSGDYQLRLQENSHEVIDAIDFSVTRGMTFDNDDDATNNTPLSNGDDYDSLLVMEQDNSTMTLMTRTDFVGTFPTTPDKDTVIYDDLIDLFGETTNRYSNYYTPDDDEETDPWYVESVPSNWTQAASTAGRVDGKTEIQLCDLIGVDYWDTNTTYTVNGQTYTGGVNVWCAYMNQLTWKEIVELCSSGGFGTVAIDAIGKPTVNDGDGPENYGDDATYFPSSLNQAATWNVDLVYLHGVISANEAMYIGKQGWYAPSFNILRCPFGGRGRSYYSEDGVQAGYIAAYTIAGAESMGVHAFAKHLALNEQETGRNGLITWASEQAIREIYLKPFEYSVKVGEHFGGAGAIMTAMNRVGAIASCGNYALLEDIVRGEWGFKGLIITDSYNSSWAKANYMQRVGCDLPLGSYSTPSDSTDFTSTNAIAGTWDEDENMVMYNGKASPTQWYAIRTTAMRILYYTATSQAMYNNLDTTLFTAEFDGKEYDINAGVNVSIDLTISDLASYGTDVISYAVVDGSLPAGLSIDATGCISGIAYETGTFLVTIRQLGCGWVPSDATITIKVSPLIESSEGWAFTAGQAFTTTLTQDTYVKAEDISVVGAIGKVEYSLLDAPDGLSITTDGVLSGTLDAGTYSVTVRITYSVTEAYFANITNMEPQAEKGGWARQSFDVYVDTTYTITIADASGSDEDSATSGKFIESATINDDGELVITYTDGTEQNLGVVVGTQGQSAGSGCSGEMGAASAIGAVCAAATVIGACVVVRKLRKKQ